MARTGRRRRGARSVALVLLALLPAAVLTAASPAPGPAGVRSLSITVPSAPGAAARIRLAADLYTPAVTPAPAVLLAHGFGQTKADLRPEAQRLQRLGYVVLAPTARGFGSSGGSIGLDSLDGEVPDARAMVDVLARSPAVLHRGGDPVVAAVGGSYGGALALMLGATDPRVDTVVAAITWHDLADALVPRSAGTVPGSDAGRVFKSGWTARLFAAGGGAGPCGRFTPRFCDLYRRLVTGEQPTEADLALLARSSPATVLDRMRAPVLLVQGLEDRLFGLDQADATAAQLAAAGAPVQVRWFDGGHDGGGTGLSTAVLDDWLRAHLRADRPVDHRFAYAVPPSATAFGETRTAGRYPGLDGTGRTAVRVAGPPQQVVNPPGGQPAAVTGIPGLSGARAGAAAGLLAAQGGTAGAATFASARLAAPAVLAGAASVRLRVVPAAGAGPAVLFAQLSVRTGDAVRTLPGGVAPIRVDLPAGGADVRVRLPATAWSLAPGDRLVLTVRATDSQFTGSAAPAAFRVGVASPVTLPVVAVLAADRSAGRPATGVLVGIGVVLLVALALLAAAVVAGRRRPVAVPAPADDSAPLEVRGLTKRFRSGFVAVDDVAFSVQRGQVLGLLGENGAGKTTTLRMVTGLVRPDAGEVRAFGVPVGPGSPVLTRLGCFIEGPGFLGQLTGRRNLDLYWAATGRPRSEAHLPEALAVADLGRAIDKPVRGYSQGMRQRLAIAQAMLGTPDLLVLDEPTNGLDPPQITALRGVLRRYAAAGRTVIVSSHLLAEVEVTCSHVVVMSHGRVVAAGAVEEVAGGGAILVGVTDRDAALGVVRRLGVREAEPRDDGDLAVVPGDVPVTAIVDALVGAGIGVTGVERGRRLEEAFLSLIGSTEPSA